MRIGGLRSFSALLLLLGSCCSCNQGGGVQSSLTTWVDGREVKANIDGPASISSSDGKALVQFAGHKVWVEKERVLVDDKELAKVPSTATKVRLDYAGGVLTVSADGKEISKGGI